MRHPENLQCNSKIFTPNWAQVLDLDSKKTNFPSVVVHVVAFATGVLPQWLSIFFGAKEFHHRRRIFVTGARRVRISVADSDLSSKIANVASISDCLEQVEAAEGTEEEDDVIEDLNREHEEAVKALEREKQQLAAEIEKLAKRWDNRDDDIVLIVVSSGIASQLTPSGRTAHSRFSILLDSTKLSTYNIMQGLHAVKEYEANFRSTGAPGTRLIVSRLSIHVIEATIISGLVVNINHNIIKNRMMRWSKRVVAALKDWKDMLDFILQLIINKIWFLQGTIIVKEKYNNFFILEFSNEQDKMFMLENGPWTVQNSLLVMYNWQLGITVENLRVEKVVVWLRFTGVPMEVILNKVALSLGELEGEVVQLDPFNDADDKLKLLRVKVKVDLDKPLLMGTFIPLGNGEKLWVSCTLERAYRVHEQCGRLGHPDKYCN
ncbi:uncharacterized protein G2W53_021857 [Senna tora]|uniref:ATP-dependent DNA helicase n=1 Tax=Senna tora TaxID=362788 RepID=A0A834WJY6_9FABA|nr:uncharacterized protein G2W53_021857 [Senna tora]